MSGYRACVQAVHSSQCLGELTNAKMASAEARIDTMRLDISTAEERNKEQQHRKGKENQGEGLQEFHHSCVRISRVARRFMRHALQSRKN
jgi:hypothetical protein